MLLPSVASGTNMELINFVLSMHRIIETSSFTICFDNDAILNNLSWANKNSKVGLQDVNDAIIRHQSGFSSPMRKETNNSQSLVKICTNMVCFPRMHFITPTLSSLSQNLNQLDLCKYNSTDTLHAIYHS